MTTDDVLRGGTPRVIQLAGEPGVGKSRLLRELRQIFPQAAWLESRCRIGVGREQPQYHPSWIEEQSEAFSPPTS